MLEFLLCKVPMILSEQAVLTMTAMIIYDEFLSRNVKRK